MEHTLNINDQSLDLPIESLFNNDTSSDNPITNVISQPTTQLPTISQSVVPQPVMHQPTVSHTVVSQPAVQLVSPQPQIKGILKNSNMAKQGVQLMQVIQNEPVKQLSQLVNTQGTSVTQQGSSVKSIQNTNNQQLEQNITNIVNDSIDEIKGFNIAGLKISYTTIFVTIGVIVALAGFYYFTKSRNQSENNIEYTQEKEVSYNEQRKVMDKSKKKKKKN